MKPSNLFISSTGSGELVMLCPFCNEEKGHLYFNPNRVLHGKRGWFHCKICNAKGDVYRLAKALKISTEELLGEGFIEDIVYPEISQLPEYSRPIYGDNSVEVVPYLNYLIGRGLGSDKVFKYHLHYCTKGRFGGRVIIPCFESEQLCYYLGRSIYPDRRRYLYPENGICSLRKSEVVYNYDQCKNKSLLCITEGAISSWAVEDVVWKYNGGCVALLGKDMSEVQYRKIGLLSPKEVCVVLDGDAINNAIDICKRLDISGYNVSVVQIPYGQDPDSLDRAELEKLIVGRYKFKISDVKLVIQLKTGVIT